MKGETNGDANRFELWWRGLKRRGEPLLRALSGLILLGLVVELCAFATLTLYDVLVVQRSEKSPSPRLELDVYRDVEWASDYFAEFDASYETRYYPYTEYRRIPDFSGRYINIDERSLRRTVPDCSGTAEDALEIYFFGGSAAWGTGSRDQATIPSRLAQRLCDRGIAARVTNFGESGYTSAQELVALLMEINAGRAPDLAIFYDGVNDVFSSYQNRAPGLPQNVVNRTTAYRVSRGAVLASLVGLAKATHSGRLGLAIAKRVMEPDSAETPQFDPALVDSTAALYLRNIEIAKALGAHFGFRSLFYWQPSLCTKDQLSEDERSKIEVDAGYQRLYLAVTEHLVGDPRVRDLSDLLDPYSRTFFIDEYHVTEEGNDLVAARIAEDVVAVPDLRSPAVHARN